MTSPKSFPLLVQLSRTMLGDAIAIIGPGFKESFLAWLKIRHRTEKVAAALEVLEGRPV